MSFRDDVFKQRQEIATWFATSKGLILTVVGLAAMALALIGGSILGWF